MKDLTTRLYLLQEKSKAEKITVMILGLGSVGSYLLDYLLSAGDARIKVVVVGRSYQKMESDVNIIKVAALIRGQLRSEVTIADNINFNHVEEMSACIQKYQPDFIVNASRVYAGLKYGSISWTSVRAYGIWSPLAMKYIKNIMEAYEMAESNAIVINTSYSDAVIPWLKSAGKSYPDFGSGNLNHLAPRIKMAAAEIKGITDFWNMEVWLATGHFHDVVISKEGHTEETEQLLKIFYQGQELEIQQEEVFALCKIPMPTDVKRNMMNASSNFEIIWAILQAVRQKEKIRFLSPGAFGELGGYPVMVDGTGDITAFIDTSVFSLEEMRLANQRSMALDGVEKIQDGCLYYTDALLNKAKRAFGVELPKIVAYSEIDETAQFIIDRIILPEQEKMGRQ